MKKTWLVFDCHYLCYRAWHALPQLAWKGRSTEVIFGFLQTVAGVRERLGSDHVVFTFEHPKNFRRDIFPAYKCRRRTEQDPKEAEARELLAIQIRELYRRHLPEAGFKNVFSSRGMESDDIMARIAQDSKDDVILVTGDADLYQCLRPNVMLYSLQDKQLKTEAWFRKQYGIHPKRWAFVKALGGCHTDQVPGIKGIGEGYALKYVRGELPPTHKAYKLIRAPASREIVRRNRKLVELPGGGCPAFNLVEHAWPLLGWRNLMQSLGIRTRL